MEKFEKCNWRIILFAIVLNDSTVEINVIYQNNLQILYIKGDKNNF